MWLAASDQRVRCAVAQIPVPHASPTRLLMIVGRQDTCTLPDPQLEVYARGREPKRLLIHPGGHFDTYTEHFELTAEAALAWFPQHLT